MCNASVMCWSQLKPLVASVHTFCTCVCVCRKIENVHMLSKSKPD